MKEPKHQEWINPLIGKYTYLHINMGHTVEDYRMKEWITTTDECHESLRPAQKSFARLKPTNMPKKRTVALVHEQHFVMRLSVTDGNTHSPPLTILVNTFLS